MRLKILCVLFMLLLPTAYSEISIRNIKDAYNIGEKIEPEVEILSENDLSGFQTAELSCGSYSKTYYVSQSGLSASFFPTLKVFPQMKGTCRVKIRIESIDNSFMEEEDSEDFEISDSLVVFVNKDIPSLNPGDKLSLTGNLYNIREEPISGTLKANLNEGIYNFVIGNSTFNYGIKLPSDIPSGDNKIMLTFEDNSENYFDTIVRFDVIARPTSISITLNDDLYLPYEKMLADVSLLDQANATLDEEMEIKILKDKHEICSSAHNSGLFTFVLNNSLEPGTYKLTAAYDGLNAESDFEIASLQKIEANMEGQTVVIKNTGNIEYKNLTPIGISGAENDIEIGKRVSLKPGESEAIDLSKEVEGGNYSVTLPTGEKIDDIYIEDNRNFMKKITGNLLRDPDAPFKSIGFGFLVFFLVVIVGLLGLQYSGVPVIPTIKDTAKSLYNKLRKK